MRQDLETSRKLGVLSGDSQKTAERVGRELGLDEVRGGLLPEAKAAYAR
jgi:cation transport ATPase